MPRISSVVIHVDDPYVMAPFWSVVTGLPPVPEDAEKLATRTLEPMESVLLQDPDGNGPDVWLARAFELKPAGRIHLDIVADAAERDEIIAAGAELVREDDDLTVFTDPEGNEFCLIRERH
jgi:hypothetical protein